LRVCRPERSAQSKDLYSPNALAPEGALNGLLRGTIELKRAELILRAKNTAVGNIKCVKFDLHSHEMVREIPNYPGSADRTSRRGRRSRPPSQPR
jgi:hypothetical protein